jgi:tetratricopeptide (TPR) repeat protein
MEDGLMQLSDEVEIELEIHTRKPDYIDRKTEGIVDSTSIVLLERLDHSTLDNIFLSVDSARANNPDFKHYILADLGNMLLAQKRYDESLAVFKRYAGLYPNELETLNKIGICHLLLGEDALARTNFLEMLSKDSLNARATEYLRLMDMDIERN